VFTTEIGSKSFSEKAGADFGYRKSLQSLRLQAFFLAAGEGYHSKVVEILQTW
jgi:hypothetical protein